MVMHLSKSWSCDASSHQLQCTIHWHTAAQLQQARLSLLLLLAEWLWLCCHNRHESWAAEGLWLAWQMLQALLGLGSWHIYDNFTLFWGPIAGPAASIMIGSEAATCLADWWLGFKGCCVVESAHDSCASWRRSALLASLASYTIRLHFALSAALVMQMQGQQGSGRWHVPLSICWVLCAFPAHGYWLPVPEPAIWPGDLLAVAAVRRLCNQRLFGHL